MLTAFATPSGARCGVERQAVKTLQDAASGRVKLIPTRSTIARLAALPRPDAVPATRSLPDVRALAETHSYILRNVVLKCWRLEPDGDYHIVLGDGAASIIAEVPDPACMGISPARNQAAAVRARLIAQLGPASAGRCAAVAQVVTVQGVLFFDAVHGQIGVAPNGVELHPVTRICFSRDC